MSGPSDISKPYWTTDDTVGPNTWGYVVGMTYFSPAAIVHAFIDRVSKNGQVIFFLASLTRRLARQSQKALVD